MRLYTLVLATILVTLPTYAADDPYLWLEDIDAKKSLDWVRALNAETAKVLEEEPLYDELYAQALAALNSKSRVPTVRVLGDYVYDLWKDDEHPRGIYRRSSLESFVKRSPVWETVVDVGALSDEEGERWVLHPDETTCLQPEYERCLIELSPGGGDASEVREMDMETLDFIDDGFYLPAAKSSYTWVDEDTILVSTDFGEGSLTTSGYARTTRRVKRGTPISEAASVFEVSPDSVAASASRYEMDEGDIELVTDGLTFWTRSRKQIVDDELLDLPMPESADLSGAYRGNLVIYLQEEWEIGDRKLDEGSIVLGTPEQFRDSPESLTVLFAPNGKEVVEDVDAGKHGILVTMLDNVRGRLYRYEETDGEWTRRLIRFPDNGAIEVKSVSSDTGGFFAQYESFTTPPTLYWVDGETLKPVEVAAQDPTFDGSKYEVNQYWATSADGTKVPYFVVADRKLERNGQNPTHIFSYGGFRNSLTPAYSGSYEQLFGAYGKMWLDRGGVFVLPNIRGGGEFGPAWHAAAINENKPRSYEDFEAVAEDLFRRKITSPEHLGIEGRSNGGLLVTATMTRRPELYGAVVAGVPLADMKRYHKLLAGASWMAEFGNPDIPEQWEWIRPYSPYQNLKEGVDYPPIFFFTSTRDDRVHPGHARKMAAKMIDLDQEVYYYENIEGGHGGSSTNEQLAKRIALAYTHLWKQLGPHEVAAETAPIRRIDRKE